MLEPLTGLVCPSPFDQLRQKSTNKKSSGGGSSGKSKVSLVNLLVVEDVLVNGSEYGSQSQDCWKYVMRCVTFALSIGGAEVRPKAVSKVKSPRPTKLARKISDDLDLNFDDDDQEDNTETL